MADIVRILDTHDDLVTLEADADDGELRVVSYSGNKIDPGAKRSTMIYSRDQAIELRHQLASFIQNGHLDIPPEPQPGPAPAVNCVDLLKQISEAAVGLKQAVNAITTAILVQEASS